ncbi:inner membrane protein YiaA [Acinetobacter sp. CFCC 10889]|uniref:inner membrane protein YiaA n=1 Tax=Acinetobacter sp. CFCC 10889 TaxID=1775557 RepID=UPI000DD03327|nr:inner membrane protein YiaA [Acinetobacter sp. CFCC 10889]
MDQFINKPTPAFIAASWVALLAGAAAYMVGLFNADMLLNEKGYYLILILYGLFSAVSLQKIIRDRLEGMHVTPIYFGLCWASVVICIVLLAMGLWNASLLLSEKGFYIMAFLLSLFGAVAVQKNIRDLEYIRNKNAPELTTKMLEENHKAIESNKDIYNDDKF